MEHNVELGLLLEWYGGLLTDRQRKLMELSLWEDLSLAEIAEQEGISRQGVRDTLQRAGQQMQMLEQELGLAERMHKLDEGIAQLEAWAEEVKLTAPEKSAFMKTLGVLRQILEEPHGI